MKKLLFAVLVGLMLVSCENDTIATFTPDPSMDTRFNGVYIYSYYWEDTNGIEEERIFKRYVFDDTDRCTYSHDVTRYTIANGWYYLDIFLRYSWYTDGNNIYFYSAYDPEDVEQYTFEFTSDGVIIGGYLYKKKQ